MAFLISGSLLPSYTGTEQNGIDGRQLPGSKRRRVVVLAFDRPRQKISRVGAR